MPDPTATVHHEAVESTLSQQEIDGIFTKIRAEQSSSETKTIKPFVFQKPDYLSSDKMQHLKVKHDVLLHDLSPVLSLILRREVILKLAKIETITLARVIEALPARTHMTLFHLEPILGSGMVEITPHLALTFVARMLGSQGHGVNTERDFTEIDLKMLDRVTDAFLREYTSMWRILEPQLNYAIDGHEQNPGFVKIADPDTIMVFMVVEVKFGTVGGFVRLALPYTTLEPLITKLTAPAQGTSSKKDEPPPITEPSKPILEVPMQIKANWMGLRLSVSELKTLQKDDVFVLGEDLSTRTSLFVGDVHKFTGQVGRKGDRLAVKITSPSSL
jgi:flagellar motor switch protein FliM